MSDKLTQDTILKAKDAIEKSTPSKFGGLIVPEEHLRQLEEQHVGLIKRAEAAEKERDTLQAAIKEAIGMIYEGNAPSAARRLEGVLK